MRRPGLPRITLPQLWLGLAVLLPGLAALLAPLSTVDLAWGLRAGGEILDGAGIPRADAWTFTVAGTPWLDQQWGAQLVLAAWWRCFGWAGLVLLRSTLIVAAFTALALAIRLRAPGIGDRTAALVVLLAFVVSSPALALRPQLIAVVLCCLTLALLAGRDRHDRLVLLVPLVVVGWANVHGSFVLGPVLAGLAWLDDLRLGRRPLGRSLAVALASGAAVLLTPFGPGALAYVLALSSDRALAARITEWQPPSPAQADGILALGSLLLVAAVALANRRRLGWTSWLTLVLFAALVLAAVRAVAWWPAVAAVTVAPVLAARPASPFRRAPRASVANSAILGLLVLAAMPLTRIGVAGDPALGTGAPPNLLAQAPAAATAALRTVAAAGERVWAPQVWGSWFELAIPAARVAVDSRVELFPADLWAEYDLVAGGRPGWQGVLDRRGVTILVVAGTQPELLAGARAEAAWRELPGSDPVAAVFVRSGR